MKKRISEKGSTIIGITISIILIISSIYLLIKQSINDYNTCINNGVDANICEELLK